MQGYTSNTHSSIKERKGNTRIISSLHLTKFNVKINVERFKRSIFPLFFCAAAGGVAGSMRGGFSMYKKGEYVVKVNDGICRIEDIVHMGTETLKPGRLYYLMVPEQEKKAKLYVPVEKDNGNFRKVMTEKEAWAFIDNIPQMDTIWISDEKTREKKYKEALQSGNPVQLAGVIKNIYIRRKERISQGKKNMAVDERYFKLAEEILYAELAFAIGGSKEDMPDIIKQRIGNQDKETFTT